MVSDTKKKRDYLERYECSEDVKRLDGGLNFANNFLVALTSIKEDPVPEKIGKEPGDFVVEGKTIIVNEPPVDDQPQFNLDVDENNVFPELRESEDERIREDLVDFVHSYGDEFFSEGKEKEQVLAWLEKQKAATVIPDELVKCYKEFYEKGGREIALVINAINSLGEREEQMGFPTTDEEMEEFLATHPKVEAPDKYKTPDWLFKQEQPVCEGLEEASINFADNARKQLFTKDYAISSIADYDHGCIDGFKAGSKWQKEQMMKETPVSDDLEETAGEYEKKHTYQRYDGGGLTPEYDATLAEAFIDGYNLCKEQMMKEAVECKIRPFDEEIWVEKDSLRGFEDGEKAHIIIVKEG